MAKILNSIVEATGQTPLIKLNRLDEGLPGNVAVKLEFYNPAGSVKDLSLIHISEPTRPY